MLKEVKQICAGPSESTIGGQAAVCRIVRRGIVRTGLAAALSCSVLLWSCAEPPLDIDSLGRATTDELDRERAVRLQEKSDQVIRFGFDLRASPQEDARQYLPFLRYLEQATGYEFELHFHRAGSTIVDELGSGKVQLAAVGAGTLLVAQARFGATPLVRGLNAEGLDRYRSVIVVAPDSPIRELSDLRGRVFAFGSFTSTQGHLIPRILLFENDVLFSDLAGHLYAGSHQEAAEAVITGRAHAAGLQDTLGEELARSGLVRIIHTSVYYPSSGIAAARGLDAEVVERIKQALLAFEPRRRHAEGLREWHKTEMARGFVEARAADYEELEIWSRRFGLLPAEASPRP